MVHRARWRYLAALSVVAIVAAGCGDDDDDDSTADTEAATDTAETTGTEATGDTGETTDTEATTDTGGTTDTGDAPSGEGDGVLTIGYLLPQSGALSFLGPPMIGGVEMAIEEINAAGGVNGADVVLVGRDDGTDPDVANAAVDDLFAENVDLIVGAAASGVSLAVIDKITTAGIPMCSPSNTGVQFSTYDDSDLYFRTAPPDNLQSQVLAGLVVDDGFTNVVVLGRSDEYGEGFANFVAEELEAAGATVADTIIFDPSPSAVYTDVAGQIAAAAPDAVVMISFDEGARVIQEAIAAGVGPADVQWYGADGIQSSSFWELVDPDDPTVVEGLRGTAPSAAPAGGEATFRERFEAFAPGVDTIYSGHAYDCTILAALAATRAGSDAPGDIAAAINDVTRAPGTVCTLVAECLEAAAADDIDYDGAAGPLDFVDVGEPGAGEYDTWEFDAEGAVSIIEESIPVAGEG
jgi:ABC-type branched-subunit amino acid transport system substrate-binding protein